MRFIFRRGGFYDPFLRFFFFFALSMYEINAPRCGVCDEWWLRTGALLKLADALTIFMPRTCREPLRFARKHSLAQGYRIWLWFILV